MRKSFFLLPLVVFMVTACSASPEAVQSARDETEKRGFSFLSETNTGSDIFFSESVEVRVSFGEGGCTGMIRFQDGGATLNIELPIPGSPTETTSTSVDDPWVEKLRLNTAFKNCFVPRTSPPTS